MSTDTQQVVSKAWNFAHVRDFRGHYTPGDLKRAFESRLVPQDPTDEPAALLIERVRRERCSSYQATIGSSRSRQGRKPRKACMLPLFDSPVVGSQDEVRLD